MLVAVVVVVVVEFLLRQLSEMAVPVAVSEIIRELRVAVERQAVPLFPLEVTEKITG